MSGHSHWAGIKHKKGIADKKKGKLFSKLAKNIISSARGGGGDPGANIKLRYAIDKARAANMPKENIDRAIKKGTGELPGVVFNEILYEGYGPGGVAIMLELLTDNRNRTAAEIKKIFEKRGGKIGDSGCVSWMFEKKAFFSIKAQDYPEDEILTLALENGAENMENNNGYYEITAAPTDFETLKRVFEAKGIQILMGEITQLPNTTVKIDRENGKKVLALLEELEEHEDVQNAHSNFDLPEDLLEEAS